MRKLTDPREKIHVAGMNFDERGSTLPVTLFLGVKPRETETSITFESECDAVAVRADGGWLW
jgi:hypothetical protein